MSSDIDINIDLLVNPSQANRELARIAKEAQQALNQYLNTALPPTIRNIGAVVTRLTVMGTAAVATAEGIDRMMDAFRNVVLRMDQLRKQASNLEDYRLNIMKLQLDYLGKQLDLTNRLKAAMNEASMMPEKAQRDKKERDAQIQAKHDEEIARSEQRAKMQKAGTEMQAVDIRTMTARNSWNWGWSGFSEYGPDITGWKKHSPTGQEANMQSFQLGGKKAEVYRNVGLGRYKASGVIIWDGKEFHYNSDEEFEQQLNRIQTQIDMSADEAQKKRDAAVKSKLIDEQHASNIRGIHETIDQEIPLKRMKEEESFWNRRASMMTEIAGAEKTADATNYALRMQMLQDEHALNLRHINETERLWREAADRGIADITEEQKQQLQERIALEKNAIQARNNILQTTNELLQPNRLSGLTGGVEDAARVQRAKEMQKALEEFETRNKAINAERIGEEAKIIKLRESEAQLQADINRGAMDYAENLTLIASHAADYETRMKAIGAMEKQGVETIALQSSHLRNMLSIEEKYRDARRKATTEQERQAAEMTKQREQKAELLRLENESRVAVERDNLARMQQSARRNQSETGITTAGNIAAEDIQAVSDFRIKIFEGMRSGTMSLVDFEMAGIEKTYKMRQSREQAMHDQRMQALRDYESQQEQMINLAYEKQVEADRKRIAELEKMKATGTMTSQDNAELDAAQSRMTDANRQREQAMESLRSDASGSVRLDADFKQRMTLEAARHREQIAYLSAIKENTGKYVSSMSAEYKELAGQTWARSAPAMFGMPSTSFNNYASKQNIPQPVIFTDNQIVAALQTIVRNTNGMRNFNGTARYGG